jgi:hypothetical protein
MRAEKLGEGFGGFVEEIVWSDVAGEEQDKLEEDLVDLERRLFRGKLRNANRTIWRIWRGDCLDGS